MGSHPRELGESRPECCKGSLNLTPGLSTAKRRLVSDPTTLGVNRLTTKDSCFEWTNKPRNKTT